MRPQLLLSLPSIEVIPHLLVEPLLRGIPRFSWRARPYPAVRAPDQMVPAPEVGGEATSCPLVSDRTDQEKQTYDEDAGSHAVLQTLVRVKSPAIGGDLQRPVKGDDAASYDKDKPNRILNEPPDYPPHGTSRPRLLGEM
jgi:hypothetical protein